ncbi:MAG: Hpt domain-containing protein [Magnetococcus sp. DMHC-6]
MSEEDDELLGMFVQEAVEHLETIEPDLLTLEENGEQTDGEIINRLFRSVHSIKGSAGFFGLTNITKLSHTMENLLGKVREKTMVPTPAVTDSLLSGLDKLQTMIGDVSNSESVDAKVEVDVIQAILDGGSGATPSKVASTPPPPPSPPPQEKPQVVMATPTASAPLHEEELTLEGHQQFVSEALKHGRQFYKISLELPSETSQRVNFITKNKALLEFGKN